MKKFDTDHDTYFLLLLLDLLEEDGALLVLAALVLEPDADDPGREAGHLRQLLLHQGVGAGVGVVARAERVQLLLVQHRPHARRLVLALVVGASLARLATWLQGGNGQGKNTGEYW